MGSFSCHKGLWCYVEQCYVPLGSLCWWLGHNILWAGAELPAVLDFGISEVPDLVLLQAIQLFPLYSC